MKKPLILLGIALTIVLSGCGKSNSDAGNSGMNHSGTDHSEMNHSAQGEVPQGLKEAANPAFKPGSEAVIQEGHMPGMKGATATIAGAYETTAYVLTYTPTTGGEPVKHHRWIIHEEIKDAGDKPFEPGAEVVLEADHMPGMNGAKATIESGEQTTVYMLDYTPTTGGDPVKNHKWVTESELAAK